MTPTTSPVHHLWQAHPGKPHLHRYSTHHGSGSVEALPGGLMLAIYRIGGITYRKPFHAEADARAWVEAGLQSHRSAAAA